MASTSAKKPPEDAAAAGPQQDQADAETGQEQAAVPAPFVGEYLDEQSRTYQLPDGPQTAERGDVCVLPADPGDGRWKPTTRKPTRLRDNHRDERQKTAERQTQARAQLLADAADPKGAGEQQ